MGMFDSLKVRVPLPRPEMQDRVFQTKSLECELDLYVITEEGKLLLRGEGEPIPLRGAIRFYDWKRVPYQNDDPEPNPLVHFSALFNQGQLIDIIELGEET